MKISNETVNLYCGSKFCKIVVYQFSKEKTIHIGSCQNVRTTKNLMGICSYGKVSSRRSVLTPKCLYGEVPVQRSVRPAKCPMAKCPVAKKT